MMRVITMITVKVMTCISCESDIYGQSCFTEIKSPIEIVLSLARQRMYYRLACSVTGYPYKTTFKPTYKDQLSVNFIPNLVLKVSRNVKHADRNQSN